MSDNPRDCYEPPTGDEPLDAVELAFVRALVPVIVAKLREAAAARQERDRRADDAAAAPGARP